MRVPLPEQLSSVPAIDNGAMGWAAQLVDGLAKIRFNNLIVGAATVTWPGGQPFSTVLQVKHGLPAQGTFFLVTVDALGMAGLTAFPALVAGVGATPQQMQVQAWTIDAQNPLAGSTCRFYWLVAN